MCHILIILWIIWGKSDILYGIVLYADKYRTKYLFLFVNSEKSCVSVWAYQFAVRLLVTLICCNSISSCVYRAFFFFWPSFLPALDGAIGGHYCQFQMWLVFLLCPFGLRMLLALPLFEVSSLWTVADPTTPPVPLPKSILAAKVAVAFNGH